MALPPINLSPEMTDLLFPLHVRLDADGIIVSAGPTLKRIFGASILGRGFLEVFTVERPRRVSGLEQVRQRIGEKLVVGAAPEGGDRIQFRAVAVPSDYERSCLLVDLSFSVHLAKCVERYDLTEADFKPNDFSIDLFYSFQTQQALLEDSQKMARALREAKVEAEQRASQDLLTGIANRGALHRKLEELLSNPDRSATFALLHIDLDDFKSVNDDFGHSAGDKILARTADVLRLHSCPSDLPARIGGDEFALVLADPPPEEKLEDFARGLVSALSMPVSHNGHSCKVGASIGIVQFNPGQVPNADRLIANSDIALYEAKNRKSEVKLLSEEMVVRFEETARLMSEIRNGIWNGEFVPYYQPQVDTANGQICGLEVLARWSRRDGSIRSPCYFLDAATRANLMLEIDRQVRRKAFAQLARWRRDGRRTGKLSLNVTASSLRSVGYLADLQEELAVVGLKPADIQLELLESILFDRLDLELIHQCRTLEEAGFALALDDFGTGHSSIATLIETPISVLKMDRSFVSGLDRNAKMQRIARAMLAMAKNMDLCVLAEGVETRSELEFLEGCGCRIFQGFYFSQPASAQDMEEWLDGWQPEISRANACKL